MNAKYSRSIKNIMHSILIQSSLIELFLIFNEVFIKTQYQKRKLYSNQLTLKTLNSITLISTIIEIKLND